jgi:hypothetical protein
MLVEPLVLPEEILRVVQFALLDVSHPLVAPIVIVFAAVLLKVTPGVPSEFVPPTRTTPSRLMLMLALIV